MNFVKSSFVAATLAFVACSFVSHSSIALGAELTDSQEDLLNKHFSPSSAAKVEIGSKLREAQNGANLTPAALPAAVMHEKTGTLTQANITGMNGTPVNLLPAPGAGKLIIVDEMEFFHDYATAAYSGGGDVTIEYATSGLDIWVFDVALVTASADDNWVLKTGNAAPFTSSASTSSASSITSSVNKAVQITNATAAFASGNAANVIKYRIRYHVVTVLT